MLLLAMLCLQLTVCLCLFGQLGKLFALLEYKDPVDIPVTAALYVAVLFTVARYAAQFLLEIVFKQLVPRNDNRKENAKRCAESAVKLVYYSFSWFWLLKVVKSLGIWENTMSCIEFFPYPVTFSIMGVYVWELGFYISGLVCHFTIETRRKDFWEMALHHLVTICLIAGSVHMQYERIGLMILLLHDISDIFLETGKIFTYMDNDPVATTAFLGLIVTWFVARCVYFPLKILRSVWVEHVGHMQIPYGIHFGLLLLILQVLNVFWFGLLLNMAYKKLFEGAEIEDTRETDVDGKKKKFK
jgi:ceramide synthetase